VADNIEAQGSIEIDAPPLVVWRLVSDVTRMGEWSPEVERCHWTDGSTGPHAGARFEGHNRIGDRTWKTTCEVVEAVEGQVFEFAVGGVTSPTSRWRYELESTSDGRTRLTESMEGYRTGLVANFIRRLATGVADRSEHNRKGIEATLARIKQAAETEAGR
jgi:uncharacterized protein YndB with AHSA1/START domain